MNVTLNYGDLFMASHGGVLRTVENIVKGRSGAHGAAVDDWSMSIEGAIAEYVVSKALDCHWAGKGLMRGLDVGHYQVRSTHHDNGKLLLHKTDNDDQVFILVTGEKLNYTVRGWMYAREGKQDAYWNTQMRSPCYAVPQSALHPMDTIP